MSEINSKFSLKDEIIDFTLMPVRTQGQEENAIVKDMSFTVEVTDNPWVDAEISIKPILRPLPETHLVNLSHNVNIANKFKTSQTVSIKENIRITETNSLKVHMQRLLETYRDGFTVSTSENVKDQPGPSRIREDLIIRTIFTDTVKNPQVEEPDPVQPENILEILQNRLSVRDTFKAQTFNNASVYEKLTVSSVLDQTLNTTARIREKLNISFILDNKVANKHDITSNLNSTSFFKISTESLANILEYVRIRDHYSTKGGKSDEATITYVVNEDNETTRYEHWSFESYAAFKGMHLGCNADGIYVLSGDNDDGEPIEAMINFGKQQFNTPQLKRVPYVYASLAGDGDVYLQVSYNEDEQYQYPARKVDEYNATARFDLGRGIKANYLTFELYNENGSKFDLRNLWIYLTELSRRI